MKTLLHSEFSGVYQSLSAPTKKRKELSWLTKQKTYIWKVITKSTFSSHPANLAVIWWRLLGCNWQISGGLDFEPCITNLSFHWNKKSSVAFLHSCFLSRSVSHTPCCHLSLWPTAQRGYLKQPEWPLPHQRLRAQLRDPGPFQGIFLLHGLRVQ